MKAFRFSLDSALRWRSTQKDIRQNLASASAVRLQAIRSALESRRAALASAAAALAQTPSGDALHSWEAWKKRCGREIADLERQVQAAQQALAADLQNLVQADRDLQLIEKLKQTAGARWQSEANREIEAFAGETFLRQVTIRKRAGA